jgi:hypothetical protein
MTNDDPKRKEVYEWRQCINVLPSGEKCGKRFFVSVAEKEYFEGRKADNGRQYALPKRCYPCRVERRSEIGSGTQHGHN